MKQGELSQIMGYSQTMISGYETGRYEPKVDTFVKIMKVLGCQVVIKPEKQGGE